MTGGSSDQPPPAPPRKVPPLWLLALITLSGTLAMHMFVPALQVAGHDLDASASAMQLTLSAYIIGLALGQLTHGPASDRFGRRPLLIAGMIVYALASIAAMLAPTITSLIIARLIQAFGGCAGLVLGRAIVRDNASGDAAARNLSLMNLMVMIGPGLAPLIGSALAALTGWRSIFAALSLLGLANLQLIWRLLPESGGSKGDDVRGIFGGYRQLLRSSEFLGYAIGGGFATTSIYAYVGAAPYIFTGELHRPAHEVGMYLTLNILGAWFGSLTASRLIGRVATKRLTVIGNVLSCLGAMVFLFFTVFGWLDVLTTVLPMLLLTFGAGIASPAALALALEINPSVSGSAAGLYGFMQMAIGALCASLSGLGTNPALAAGTVLLLAGVVAQSSFWFAQHGARPRAASR